jgi:predicted DNA-binding antitoxin AbrB/MazE fold protein
MPTTITATYRDGVLYPTIPLELQNHQTIQIQIVEPEMNSLLDRLQASGFVTTAIARSTLPESDFINFVNTLPIPTTPTSQTIIEERGEW